MIQIIKDGINKLNRSDLRKIIKEELDKLTEAADGKVISQVRDIVDSGQHSKISGKVVDTFTAQHIIQLYDQVNDSIKEKLNRLSLEKLVILTWKMFK